VGAWVKRVVRRLNLPDQNWFEPLARDWPEFAGLPLARHAVPGRFVQSTLYLFVDSAPWLFEIKTRHLAGLTGRIKARYPAVREVRLELNPAPPPRKTGGGSG